MKSRNLATYIAVFLAAFAVGHACTQGQKPPSVDPTKALLEAQKACLVYGITAPEPKDKLASKLCNSLIDGSGGAP